LSRPDGMFGYPIPLLIAQHHLILNAHGCLFKKQP
jgi:hypothetical protein